MIDARNGTYRDLVVNAGKPWDNAMFSDDNATRIAKVGNAGSVSIPAYIYDFASQKMIQPQYDTDWQDELYRNAQVHRHNLAFSGGTSDVHYALSGGLQNQEGIMLGTGQNRINFRGNIDANVNKKVKVGANLAFTSADSREVLEGRFNQGPILGALVYMPFFKAYNEDGSLAKFEAASQSAAYGFQTIENPVALALETKINRQGLRGTYNGYAQYEVLPGLSLKANLGMQTYQEKYEFYQPTSLSNGANAPGSPQAVAAAKATSQTQLQRDELAEFTFNYKKQFGKHSVDVLGGYSAQKTTNDLVSVSAQGFQNDRITEITGKGADPSNFYMNTGTGKSANTLLSYFSRAVYQFDNRYMLSATFRTDGSSRFGRLNRWGSFPSVSAGWNISNESFYANTFGSASTLKLRASWGLSGNNNIGNYNQEQVMSNPGGVVFGANTIATAMWPGNIMDEKLGWESTSQYNVGVDLGLFQNRLQVLSNFYVSNSYNLLFNQSISAVSGAASMLTNLRDSRIQNKGFDLQVDGKVVSAGDFNLNVGGNVAVNRNKVLDMGGASTIMSAGAERSYLTHITQTGQPVGMFYGFTVMGMVREADMENIKADAQHFDAKTQSYPQGYVLQGPPRSMASSNPLQPGDLYFEDVNQDGIVNDADKRVIGSPHPKFTFGLSLTMNYKNFDFSSSFNGAYGNQVLDGQDYYIFNMEGSGNQYAKVADRYRSELEPGKGTVYRASRGGTQSNSTRLSTFYLQDGSFFRCTNLTIGYTLPAGFKQIGVSNIRLYGSIDNAFTLTKYLGYNPEVDYNNGTNLTPGVDYGKYPLVRAFSLGGKLTF
jgi:TonB-linked SusC/RagA family outer membrane protein